MSLLPLFQWMNSLAVSKAINESNWAYAIIQAFHLVALSVFFGAVLVVDLRLLGKGFNQQPLREVARDAQPWLIGGFAGLIITGIPQLLAGAMKEYNIGLFWIKMYVLVAATIFTFIIRARVTRADEQSVGPLWSKVVAVVSTGLWVGVAVPARLIGLFG